MAQKNVDWIQLIHWWAVRPSSEAKNSSAIQEFPRIL